MWLQNKFDELNVVHDKDEEITEQMIKTVLSAYFEPMGVSDEQKEKRVELAYDLYVIFFSIFTSIQGEIIAGNDVDYGYFENLLSIKYMNTVYADMQHLDDDENIPVYIPSICNLIMSYTQEQIEKATADGNELSSSSYLLSQDRSVRVAQSEALTIASTDEFDEASANGCTLKTWCTVGDNRVRSSHVDLEGTTIELEEMFVTMYGDELLYPRDISNGAGANEVDGCRCWLEYS